MKAPFARSFFDLLRENATERPDAVAVIAGDRTATYQELYARAGTVALALRRHGVRRGDRVGLLAGNCMEWLEIAFGAAALGAVVVPFSTWAKPSELEYLIADSCVTILFSVARFGRQNFIETLSAVLGGGTDAGGADRFPRLGAVVVVGECAPGWTSYQDFLSGTGEFAPLPPGTGASATDDMFILYTSGSTARPKAVRVVHFAAIENAFNIGERQKLTPQDRVLVSPPLFWIYACGNALPATFSHGATLVLQAQFDADEAIDLIDRHRCTSIYTLPAMTRALVRSEKFAPARTRSLRTGLTIGSPSDVETAATTLGARDICNIYGATEIYGNCCVTPCDWPLERRMNCQGPPLPGVTVRIVDPETRAVLPQGEIGEAEVAGYRTPGYAGASAEYTAKAVTADGFFRTGDLGFLDKEGNFHFASRSSEIIKRSGINVSPAEIEEHLQRYGGVHQAGVVGAPDEEKGEIIVAFVVPQPGASLEPDAIRQYCRSLLSSYKVPDRVEICTSLPSTETGKIARRQLKELAVRVTAAPAGRASGG